MYINLTNLCTCRCVFCIRDLNPTVEGVDMHLANLKASASDIIENIKLLENKIGNEITFCGYGEPGTVISFYEYDSASATYKRIELGGAPVTVTVNASGVFWKKIDFEGGYHKVIIYAEKNGGYQTVRREINVLSVGSASMFKEYSVLFR